MLLLLNDRSGRPIVGSVQLDHALAGAVLLELANTGRLSPAGPDDDAKEGRLLVRDASATGDPVLDRALARLETKPFRARRAILSLAKGIRKAVREQLVANGLLHRQDSTLLGVIPYKSWSLTNTDRKRQLHERLTAVLLHGETPDAHVGGLVVLLDAIRAVSRTVDGDRKQIRARAKEIAAGDWAGVAVRQAVRAVNAATAAALNTGTSSP
jgi:hypothetical protein